MWPSTIPTLGRFGHRTRTNTRYALISTAAIVQKDAGYGNRVSRVGELGRVEVRVHARTEDVQIHEIR